MASAMASAAARNIPAPYTIPIGPRVRPPRLLPGTKAANTNPQPDEPPPEPGHVWVQGKWRNPASNAARDRREVESVKTEKALRHAIHGVNIYAYSHLRTNQVVYSLTRVMQNNKILPQLMFHGKQTVPSSLRRDMWRPYFSIHFPQTPAGAQAGLLAYRRLRELATERQLSPPRELVTTTKADVKKAKAKYSPFTYVEEKEACNLKNIPVRNQLLPKKLRAKKLMDQKASSVADAAFVLEMVGTWTSPAEQLDAVTEQRATKHEAWSKRALKRLNEIREEEAAKGAQISARQERIEPTQGQLGLTPHAARRIAAEYGGAVAAPWKGTEYMVKNLNSILQKQEATENYRAITTSTQTVMDGERRPAEIDTGKFRSEFIRTWKEQHKDATEGPSVDEIKAAISQEKRKIKTAVEDYEKRLTDASSTNQEFRDRNNASRTVQMLWADLRDATWAKQWSSNVYHGELEQRLAIKHERTLARQRVTIDEEGNEIPGQLKKVVVQSSTSPHICGMNNQKYSVNNQAGWYETAEKLSAERQEWRTAKLSEWQNQKLEKSREIIQEMNAIHRETIENNSPEADEKFEAIKTDYPYLYEQFSSLAKWREGLDSYTTLLKIKDELRGLKSSFDSQNPRTSERLQSIDATLSTIATEDSPLTEIISPGTNTISLETDLITSINVSHQRIAQRETRVAELESLAATEEPVTPETQLSLRDARSALENEHNLILSSRAESWTRRANAIEDMLSHISTESVYLETGIIDLVQQRLYAEQSGSTEQVARLDEDIKAREDDELAVLLGIKSEVEARIMEVQDPAAREKGLEMPMPVEEKKGIWGRIKGVFGR